MRRTPRRLATLLGAAALVIGLAACGSSEDSLASQAAAGDEKGYIAGDGVVTQLAPGERGEPIVFDSQLSSGEDIALADWQGDVVVLNLWYAACPPCRTEAPALQGSFEKNEADGVKFLGVNVRDEAPAAEAFKRTFELTFPSVIDTDGGAVAALSQVLPPQATPSTVVLDREGRAAARVVGEVDESTLNGLIDDVLAEDS